MITTPTDLPKLIKGLRQIADRLEDVGNHKPSTTGCRCVLCRAPILAARSWPVSTNGTDGGRSSDPTSSTERAALNPGPFDGIDYRMRTQMSTLWAAIVFLHGTLDTVMTHASDDDAVPVQTGRCLRCDKFCRPDPKKNPHDRIKSGFCPACYTAWIRAGSPERSSFMHSYIADEAG